MQYFPLYFFLSTLFSFSSLWDTSMVEKHFDTQFNILLKYNNRSEKRINESKLEWLSSHIFGLGIELWMVGYYVCEREREGERFF